MAWLLIPGSDRAAARKLVARIDQILGYPREETAATGVVHVGPGRHPAVVRTESQTMILVHDATGPALLDGVIAISTDAVVDAMKDRLVDVRGVKQRIQDIIAERGWEVRAALPDPADETRDPWTRVEPRDGAQGSADGVPVPEGQE